LTIVVEAGNPLGISRLEDLTRGDITLVACAPVVPCGAAAVEIQAASGVTLNPASEEANVSDVLGKVANGQADAGLVYVTDVSRAEGVESVAFAGSAAATTAYPIGAVASSPHTEAAEAFVAYVLGPRGQAVLASHGFAAP
jgi:molybdate transport system substrate-binding protein